MGDRDLRRWQIIMTVVTAIIICISGYDILYNASSPHDNIIDINLTDGSISTPTLNNLPATGYISVTSSPNGATIYLDDVYKGETPKDIENVEQGSHIITLKLDGYENYSQIVSVDAGKVVSILPILAPSASTPQTVPDYIDTVLQKIGRSAQIIFKPSEKMKVNETEIVRAYITENTSKDIKEVIENNIYIPEEINENGNISDVLENNSTLISRNITVTPEMEVKLTESPIGTFFISPMTSERQYVGSNVTEWNWKVTPLKPGNHTLILSVNYIITTHSSETATNYLDPNVDFNESITCLKETIEVEASRSQEANRSNSNQLGIGNISDVIVALCALVGLLFGDKIFTEFIRRKKKKE